MNNKIKIILSFVLILVSFIFIFMIRPIGKSENSKYTPYSIMYKKLNDIEVLSYAYRLKFIFNENLFYSMNWRMLIQNDKCNGICFIAMFESLKSAKGHISNKSLGSHILDLRKITESSNKKVLDEFYNEILNKKEQKEVYCDYYKFNKNDNNHNYCQEVTK